MTKRMLSLLLVCLLLLGLCAGCGKRNQEKLVGTWDMVSSTGVPLGITLTFHQDGSMTYGTAVTIDMENEAVQDFMDSNMGALMAEAEGTDKSPLQMAAEKLVKLEYQVKSGSRMVVRAKLALEILQYKKTIRYRLRGNQLKFDGISYRRADSFD